MRRRGAVADAEPALAAAADHFARIVGPPGNVSLINTVQHAIRESPRGPSFPSPPARPSAGSPT